MCSHWKQEMKQKHISTNSCNVLFFFVAFWIGIRHYYAYLYIQCMAESFFYRLSLSLPYMMYMYTRVSAHDLFVVCFKHMCDVMRNRSKLTYKYSNGWIIKFSDDNNNNNKQISLRSASWHTHFGIFLQSLRSQSSNSFVRTDSAKH